MSRRDLGVMAGVVTAVFTAAALLLVAIYGPEGALNQVTGSAAPSTNSSNGAPASVVAAPAPNSPGPNCPVPSPVPANDFRLLIPRLGVNAHSESLGLDAQGNLGTPSGKFCNVGWYSHGPSPGAPGDAVMDAHLDWDGKPAVFWKLGSLKAGDEVIVHRDGAVLHFRVSSLNSVPYNAHPPDLFVTTGGPRLTLITCAGDYDFKRATYLQRLIVTATYVSRTV